MATLHQSVQTPEASDELQAVLTESQNQLRLFLQEQLQQKPDGSPANFGNATDLLSASCTDDQLAALHNFAEAVQKAVGTNFPLDVTAPPAPAKDCFVDFTIPVWKLNFTNAGFVRGPPTLPFVVDALMRCLEGLCEIFF
jgi:hypothetical protein